jgi:hypothetical protein
MVRDAMGRHPKQLELSVPSTELRIQLSGHRACLAARWMELSV